jgi:hypothetical protein
MATFQSLQWPKMKKLHKMGLAHNQEYQLQFKRE